jgi:hypothetical protein
MKPDPISDELRAGMHDLCSFIDDVFNGNVRPKRVGFALLIYNLGEELEGTGRINYIGNGQRGEVLVALKELVARWEGRYSETDTAQQ